MKSHSFLTVDIYTYVDILNLRTAACELHAKWSSSNSAKCNAVTYVYLITNKLTFPFAVVQQQRLWHYWVLKKQSGPVLCVPSSITTASLQQLLSANLVRYFSVKKCPFCIILAAMMSPLNYTSI